MGLLRCLECDSADRVHHFLSLYPHLLSLVGSPPLHTPALRDHCVELARQEVVEKVDALKGQRDQLPDFEVASRKEHILRKLQRLIPGECPGLSVLASPGNGEFATQPIDIASLLKQHWGGVFCRRPVDLTNMRNWGVHRFASFPQAGLHAEHSKWQLRLSHVVEAIRTSGDSSPGPDGIPYRAWRKLEDFVAPILYDAALSMQESSTIDELPPGFNHSHLCCLPKKPAGTHPAFGEFYTAAKTRPMSLINTDNRLLASSYRSLLEPLADAVVPPMQRGFLRGRSLLRNAFEIDHASMLASLEEKNAVLILFDFEAALPSISRDFRHPSFC